MKNTFLAFYLALKEVLRNRGRFAREHGDRVNHVAGVVHCRTW